MKVWLITWDGPNIDQTDSKNVAGIFSAEVSHRTILRWVEVAYMNAHYTLSERLHFIQKPADNPYRAAYRQSSDGTNILDKMSCGHNPYLYARIVDEFKVTQENGKEKATWREIPST